MRFKGQLLVIGLLVGTHIHSTHVFGQETAPSSTSVLPDGVQWPALGTVFALDTAASKQALLPIEATNVNVSVYSDQSGSQIYSIIDGKTLPTAVQDASSKFYVRMNEKDSKLMQAQIHLIRLKLRGKDKLISVSKRKGFSPFDFKLYRNYMNVPILEREVVSNTWLEIKPEAPLVPGDYCLVFLPENAQASPTSAYDFKLIP